MSITVNGQSCVPPGFRFHPTEEELLGYYLRKKVASEKIDLDVIRDVDLNKLEPWDIQEECRIGSTPQSDWYFFSHKDKKYPTGTRTNRATAAGFWKATGRDKTIFSGAGRIGMRKTLVFYKGRAPRGQKSDWIMHEYRLDDHPDSAGGSTLMGEAAASCQEEGWVVCRVFKKKSHGHHGHHHKATSAAGPGDSPKNSSSVTSDAKTQQLDGGGGGDGALDQILHYMGRSYCGRRAEFSGGDLQEMFMKLPALDIPSAASSLIPTRSTEAAAAAAGAGNWAAIDRLLASRLNGTSEDDITGGACFEFSSSSAAAAGGDYEHDHGDLWSLTKTSSSTVSSGGL